MSQQAIHGAVSAIFAFYDRDHSQTLEIEEITKFLTTYRESNLPISPDAKQVID